MSTSPTPTPSRLRSALSRSGGGAIPLTNAELLAAFATSLGGNGHVLGEVDWNFAAANAATNFLNGGEKLDAGLSRRG